MSDDVTGGPRLRAQQWEPGKRRHPAARSRVIAGAVSVAGMAGLTITIAATQGGASTLSSSATATTPTTAAPRAETPLSPFGRRDDRGRFLPGSDDDAGGSSATTPPTLPRSGGSTNLAPFRNGSTTTTTAPSRRIPSTRTIPSARPARPARQPSTSSRGS